MTFPTNTPRLKAAILAAHKAENNILRGIAEGEIAAAAIEDLPIGCHVQWTTGRGKRRIQPPSGVGRVLEHRGSNLIVRNVHDQRVSVPVRDVFHVIK